MTLAPQNATPERKSLRKSSGDDAAALRGKLRHSRFYFCVWIVAAMLLAACGTAATPVYEAPTATSTLDQAAGPPRLEPTDPPTETPLPPTATASPQPTATNSPAPTATPEPTATAVLSPLDRMVAMRDPENGAVLFETFQETAGTGYSCANCHSPTSEDKLVGPGLLNIKSRALTRVDGQSAAEYIYNSIVNPTDIVVEDYDPELMPANWADIYTNLELLDIVAYLLTLQG